MRSSMNSRSHLTSAIFSSSRSILFLQSSGSWPHIPEFTYGERSPHASSDSLISVRTRSRVAPLQKKHPGSVQCGCIQLGTPSLPRASRISNLSNVAVNRPLSRKTWSCKPSVWLAVARGFYLAGSDRSRVCAPCAGTVLSAGGSFVLISGLPWAYRGLRSPPATMACPLPHRGFTSMPKASSRRASRRSMRPGLCLRGGEPLEGGLIELPVGGLSLFGLEGA